MLLYYLFKQSIIHRSLSTAHAEIPTCIPSTGATRMKANKPQPGCAGFLFAPRCKATLFYNDFLIHLCFVVNSKDSQIVFHFQSSHSDCWYHVTHLSHLLSQHLHIGCHGEARPLENLFEKTPATSIRHNSYVFPYSRHLWYGFLIIYNSAWRIWQIKRHGCVCTYRYMHTGTTLFKKLRHAVILLPYKASNILFLLYYLSCKAEMLIS